MQFDFDFQEISHQELLIATGDQDVYTGLMVDASVQTCLKAMLEDTVMRFSDMTHEEIPNYELAEKYSTEELVKASLAVAEYANLLTIFGLEGVAQSTGDGRRLPSLNVVHRHTQMEPAPPSAHGTMQIPVGELNRRCD